MSRTVRVIGPIWSREKARGATPRRLTLSVGRLHAGNAAHRGRIADRAAGVGAERRREEAGGETGTAAARRAAAKMIAVPRVARRRPRQVEGWAADGEFVGRELAEQHPAGRFEPLRDHRVPAGDIAHQDLGMRRGRKTLDVDDVLQRIGHAMERTAPASGGNFGLGRARRLQRPLWSQCDKSIVLAVMALDAGKQRRCILDRRQFLGADQLGSLSQPQIGEIAAHTASPFAR